MFICLRDSVGMCDGLNVAILWQSIFKPFRNDKESINPIEMAMFVFLDGTLRGIKCAKLFSIVFCRK